MTLYIACPFDLCGFYFWFSWLPNTKLLILKKNYFKSNNYENCWCGVDETRNVAVLMQKSQYIALHSGKECTEYNAVHVYGPDW